MEVAIWCDIRVMEETSYMGVYNRRWGIPLIDGGTAFKEALQGIIILGNVINARVMPATRGVDLGRSNVPSKIPKPNKPNTIDGTAARLFILISIKSVIRFLGANSSKYIDANIAIGKDNNKVIIIVKKDPTKAPPIPASSGFLESPF